MDQPEHDHAWREINHRVANSFQMLSAALLAQTRDTDSPEVKSALRSASDRVRYMSEVQRLLYGELDDDVCDFVPFLTRLCGALEQAYCAPGRRVLVTAFGEIRLSRDSAATLGRVVSELVINACKHAWPDGEPGTVRVQACVVQGVFHLSVADDGRGLGGSESAAAGGGLGGQILAAAARRLGAELIAADAPAGARFTLSFPLAARAAPVDLCA